MDCEKYNSTNLNNLKFLFLNFYLTSHRNEKVVKPGFELGSLTLRTMLSGKYHVEHFLLCYRAGSSVLQHWRDFFNDSYLNPGLDTFLFCWFYALLAIQIKIHIIKFNSNMFAMITKKVFLNFLLLLYLILFNFFLSC